MCWKPIGALISGQARLFAHLSSRLPVRGAFVNELFGVAAAGRSPGLR